MSCFTVGTETVRSSKQISFLSSLHSFGFSPCVISAYQNNKKCSTLSEQHALYYVDMQVKCLDVVECYLRERVSSAIPHFTSWTLFRGNGIIKEIKLRMDSLQMGI